MHIHRPASHQESQCEHNACISTMLRLKIILLKTATVMVYANKRKHKKCILHLYVKNERWFSFQENIRMHNKHKQEHYAKPKAFEFINRLILFVTHFGWQIDLLRVSFVSFCNLGKMLFRTSVESMKKKVTYLFRVLICFKTKKKFVYQSIFKILLVTT